MVCFKRVRDERFTARRPDNRQVGVFVFSSNSGRTKWSVERDRTQEDRRNTMTGYRNGLRAALMGQSWRMLMVVPGSLRRRLVRHVPRPLLYSLSWVLMLGMPDRVLLDRRIIPALIDSGAKTVLSIGVAYYNAHHPAVFAARGAELVDLAGQAVQDVHDQSPPAVGIRRNKRFEQQAGHDRESAAGRQRCIEPRQPG